MFTYSLSNLNPSETPCEALDFLVMSPLVRFGHVVEKHSQNLLHRRGLHLTRYASTIHARRQRLLDHSGVLCLIDVGANRGQYALERRRHGYRGRLLSLEPLKDPFDELERVAKADPLWEVQRVAVGAHEGALDINVSGEDIYSSALPVLDRATSSDPRSAAVAHERVPMTTLDKLAEGLRGPVGVKIDVQGFERAVLEGGSDTLKHAAYLEVELSMVALYQDQILYLETLETLNAFGFILAAVEPLFPDPRTGQMLQMNGLFLRS